MPNRSTNTEGNGGGPRIVTTTPDPSVLTTEALAREILALKELVFIRLDGMDKAVDLFSETLTRTPTDVDKQISHLKALHEEKFQGVEKQFMERDVRIEQAAVATKIAVDAALSAAKEAVGSQNLANAAAITKSEAATVKQLDGIIALIGSNTKGTDEKISDIKSRLDRGDGGDGQRIYSHDNYQKNGAMIIAAIAAVVSFASLITTVIIFLSRSGVPHL
jgi:hypothetical protein